MGNKINTLISELSKCSDGLSSYDPLMSEAEVEMHYKAFVFYLRCSLKNKVKFEEEIVKFEKRISKLTDKQLIIIDKIRILIS